jgi:hypothetical protein
VDFKLKIVINRIKNNDQKIRIIVQKDRLNFLNYQQIGLNISINENIICNLIYSKGIISI